MAMGRVFSIVALFALTKAARMNPELETEAVVETLDARLADESVVDETATDEMLEAEATDETLEAQEEAMDETFQADATDETLDAEASNEITSTACKSLMARSVCLPDTKFLVSNLMGHDASSLNCLKVYCEEQGKQNCCDTLNGLKKALAGHTASSLHISEDKYQKLKTAAHITVATSRPPKPQVNIYTRPTPGPTPRPTPQDSRATGGRRGGGQPTGTLNATGGGVAGKCFCPIGTRSVNLAGLGPYDKSNWQLQSINGGKCTGSCDTCMRVFQGDRLPCCVMLDAKTPGRCGKEIKGADFKGQRCMCGGLTMFKEELSKKNPNCMPDSPCSQCGYNCANVR